MSLYNILKIDKYIYIITIKNSKYTKIIYQINLYIYTNINGNTYIIKTM